MLDEVIAHARHALPAECCGLLIGAGSRIVEVTRARNLSADPQRFLIDPQCHFGALRDARRRGLGVVGFYHSHPRSAPEPSPADLAEASYPDHLYLIVSLQREPPDARLFRFDGSRFREATFVTAPPMP